MSWRLVFQLSLFGLAMGLATVFLMPSKIEPLFWLVVFGISAYLIATRTSAKRFQHGLVVGIANSIWVTASHIVLFERYTGAHPREAAMMQSMPIPDSPRVMMAVVGPAIGVVSGALIGLLALLAANLIPSRGGPATSTP